MDIGAFVQENRKWLIGCGIGGLVFLIAYKVIGSIYDPGAVRSQTAALQRTNSSSSSDGVYGRQVLDTARAEQEQLAAEKLRLQQELAFQPSPKYQLANNGAADQYLFQVGRQLKQGILTAGGERGVQITEKEVSWPVPTNVDEIRGVLFGLELIDECAQRLFAAHDAVRTKNPEAIGLRAILSLKTESRTGQRTQMRSNRPGEVVLSDHVVQERVTFKFQSDAPTFAAFFESCRKPGRTLVLDGVTVVQPERASDPLTVNGVLLGIAFKEAN